MEITRGLASLLASAQRTCLVDPQSGQFSTLSAALAYVSLQTPTATNRWLIFVRGQTLETTPPSLVSHVDVVGLGTASVTYNLDDTNPTMLAASVADLSINDLIFYRTGALTAGHSANAGTINGTTSPTANFNNVQWMNLTTGQGTSHGLQVDSCSPTLNGCQAQGGAGGNNCLGYLETGATAVASTSSKWYGGTAGTGCHGGSFQTTAAGSHWASYFQGGPGGTDCYGVQTRDLASALIDGCAMVGGMGGDRCMGYAADHGAGCHVVGGFILGGKGGANCYGAYGLGTSVLYLAGTQVQGGKGLNCRAVFCDEASSPQMDGVSLSAHQTLSNFYNNAATATDQLPPAQSSDPYAYTGALLVVNNAHPGWTLSIGSTLGGHDIVNGASLGTAGRVPLTVLAFPILAAGTNVFLTVTGGTPAAGDYTLYAKAVYANTGCEALYLNTTGLVQIGVGTLLSNPASDACHVTAVTVAAAQANVNNFRISSTTIEALQAPTSPMSSIHTDTAWFPSGFYDCTLVGAFGGSGGTMRLGAAAGNSMPGRLQFSSDGIWRYVQTKTTTYTVGLTDDVILLNPTGGAFTVTLPSATSQTGKQVTLKNGTASTNAVTVATTSAQTIDGAASATMNTAWAILRLMSNGANWVTV